MANTFSPFGLLPFGRRDGGSPTAGLTRVFVASSDANPIYCGDLVKDSSSQFGPNFTNYVTWDSSGVGYTRGVFMGCEYYNSNVGRVVWSRYFPGATGSSNPDVTAYIIDDPDQLFIAQCSTNAVMGSSVVGMNIATVVSSTGSTLDGHSVLSLASSLGGVSTASYPLRVVDTYVNYAPPGVNGTDNTTAGTILVVSPNNWARNALTARTS